MLIHAPISSVFDFVSNHENYIRWFPGVIGISAQDSLPHGTVGKVYRETLKLPSGRPRSFSIRVVESQATFLFSTEGDLEPIYPRMEMSLTSPTAAQTLLSLKFFSRSTSVLGRVLVRALLKKSIDRQSEGALINLKRILESAHVH